MVVFSMYRVTILPIMSTVVSTLKVTGSRSAAEAAKMLLVAAGYNPATEGFVGGDWSINVNAKASALGIFRNYTMMPRE